MGSALFLNFSRRFACFAGSNLIKVRFDEGVKTSTPGRVRSPEIASLNFSAPFSKRERGPIALSHFVTIRIQEAADQPHGDSNAGVLDAFGNTWYIATHIPDVHP